MAWRVLPASTRVRRRCAGEVFAAAGPCLWFSPFIGADFGFSRWFRLWSGRPPHPTLPLAGEDFWLLAMVSSLVGAAPHPTLPLAAGGLLNASAPRYTRRGISGYL